jgi:hypothetical protein
MMREKLFLFEFFFLRGNVPEVFLQEYKLSIKSVCENIRGPRISAVIHYTVRSTITYFDKGRLWFWQCQIFRIFTNVKQLSLLIKF